MSFLPFFTFWIYPEKFFGVVMWKNLFLENNWKDHPILFASFALSSTYGTLSYVLTHSPSFSPSPSLSPSPSPSPSLSLSLSLSLYLSRSLSQPVSFFADANRPVLIDAAEIEKELAIIYLRVLRFTFNKRARQQKRKLFRGKSR
jgi:hypothetical protein